MAPIPLFFGANSSGKSSIGQFLMMLKQTVESSDRKAVFYPGGRNSAVRLGSYQEMVFHRDPANRIAFEYRWSLQDALKFKDPVSGRNYSGDALAFQAKVGLDDRDQHTLVLYRLNYDLLERDTSKLSIGMERKPEAKSEYRVEATNYVLKRKQGRVWYPGAPVRFLRVSG